MNLFRIDLDKLAYKNIADFCSQNILEGVRLEYKRELSSSNPEKQLTKAVSALANTQGGLLIFGVGTKNNSKRPDWPSAGMLHDPSFEQKAVRWCIEYIDPPIVPLIGYVSNPDDSSKAFAVLRIEPSMFSPHTVETGTRVYVRRADNSDPVDATIREIELLRDRRSREIELNDKHEKDLRHRIGLEKPPDRNRALALFLTPIFGNYNAIPFTDLPDVANQIRVAGFKIGKIESYSQGILCRRPDGFDLAITERAALAYRNVSSFTQEKITLKNLLAWSIMATGSAKILAEKSGYWGPYRTTFEAYNYGGLYVSDEDDDQLARCADNEIRITQTWQTTELRENLVAIAGRLYWQMMWSFGQHDYLWNEEVIRARLKELVEERKI